MIIKDMQILGSNDSVRYKRILSRFGVSDLLASVLPNSVNDQSTST